MKIKVVVDKSNKDEWTYAVYHGFARPFIIPAFVFTFLFRQSIGLHFYCQVLFPLH